MTDVYTILIIVICLFVLNYIIDKQTYFKSKADKIKNQFDKVFDARLKKVAQEPAISKPAISSGSEKRVTSESSDADYTEYDKINFGFKQYTEQYWETFSKLIDGNNIQLDKLITYKLNKSISDSDHKHLLTHLYKVNEILLVDFYDNPQEDVLKILEKEDDGPDGRSFEEIKTLEEDLLMFFLTIRTEFLLDKLYAKESIESIDRTIDVIKTNGLKSEERKRCFNKNIMFYICLNEFSKAREGIIHLFNSIKTQSLDKDYDLSKDIEEIKTLYSLIIFLCKTCGDEELEHKNIKILTDIKNCSKKITKLKDLSIPSEDQILNNINYEGRRFFVFKGLENI